MKRRSMPSTPKVTKLKIGGLGGGFVIVNSYGEYSASIGHLQIGHLGETWHNEDDALDALHTKVIATSEKCTATDMNIGGCGMLLFFEKGFVGKGDKEMQQQLLHMLVSELHRLAPTTTVYVMPGEGVTDEDLSYIYESAYSLQRPRSPLSILTPSLDNELNFEVKEDDIRTYQSIFMNGKSNHPFLHAFDSKPNFLERKNNSTPKIMDIFTEGVAQSTYGTLETLIKSQKWNRHTHIILAIGHGERNDTNITMLEPLYNRLYQLLSTEGGYDVEVMTRTAPQSPSFSNVVPSRAFVSWDPTIRCDVLVACTSDAFQLILQNMDNVSRLRCHALISISDNLLTPQRGTESGLQPEKILHCLEDRGILHFCDGLCDVGGITAVHQYMTGQKQLDNHSATGGDEEDWLFFGEEEEEEECNNWAVLAKEMGVKVMRQCLHLAKIMEEFDNDQKRYYHHLMAEMAVHSS